MNAPDYISGFLLGLSLIIAIGSQNAFVLKQGLKREHIFFVCLFCAVSDALLISAGVGGFGAVTACYPQVVDIAKNLKPSERGEIEITDINRVYLEKGQLQVNIFDSLWEDAGTFDSLLNVSNIMAEKEKARQSQD